jgi:hypothetical protein
VFDNIEGVRDSGDDQVVQQQTLASFSQMLRIDCRQGRGCFRLGEESLRVIDHMNAIGAPFAREYGTPTGAIRAGVDRIGGN